MSQRTPAVPTADQLFERHRQEIFVRTDRLFAGLMAFQYVGGIVAALALSPSTYEGTTSHLHPHVIAAVVIGALISFPPIALAFLLPGRAVTRYVISACQSLSSGLLIHLTGGRIETHFHVFGSLAFLAFYRDWRVLVPATLVTAADHFCRGLFLPQSVFGVLAASHWRWLEHAGWVIFEDVFLIGSCVANVREMRATAAQTAETFRKNAELTATRDTALDCVIGMDHLGRITDFNAAAEQTFGVSCQDVLGRPLADIIVPPALRAAHNAGLEKYLRTGEGPVLGKRIEVPAVRADGSEFPVELAINAVRLNGPPIFVAYLRDIAERKRMESELRESRERFELAVRGSSDGLWDWDVVSGAVYYSPRFLAQVGYVEGELPGHVSTFEQLVHPEDLAAVRQAIADAHARRTEIYRVEFRMRHKDGSHVWILSRGVVLHDADGRAVRMAGAHTDITEQRHAAEALRAAEEKFRGLFENSVLGIFQSTREGHYLSANPALARIYGYDSSEHLVSGLVDIGRQHYVDPGRRAELIRTLDRDGTVSDFEAEIRRTDGSHRWVSKKARVVRDANGQPLYYEGTVEDITERKAAQAALRRAKEEADAARQAAEAANVAKSQFLANMSHEIRTPLNGVIGMAELLIRKGGLTDQQLRYASVIKSSGDSLLSLINDVLDFSKIEAGKLELSPIEFDLRTAVEDVVEMLSPKAAAKGLAFACQVPSNAPARVTGDPDRVRQILVNLVNNAIKFTEAGEVVIHTSVVERDARQVTMKFSVRDTGLGIPPERLDRLFKSFSQVDASMTRKYGGTGLGLAIVKQLAELMGGTVGVESVAGRGSTFWFTARFAIVAASADDHGKSVTLANAMRGLRVLAVDDQPTYLEVLREQLAPWGLDLHTCTSGDEAIRMIRASATAGTPFRLAIVDMLMPGTDGPEVARRVTSDPALRDTSLVLLTAMDNPFDPQAMRAIGFAACLTKPVRHSTLFDTLADILSRKTPSVAQGPAMPSVVDRAIRAHVLLAEDNEVNQEVAREILTDAGCTVEVVGNGAAAVAASLDSAKRFDLILMDCQMPEMDGFEATRRIRAAKGNSLPILALTANAIAGDRERCLEAGMSDYVSKPIDPDVLLATIRKLLAGASPAPSVPAAAAVAAPAAPRVSSPSTPIDTPALLNRCRGKAELAGRLLNTFAASVDGQLAELRATLDAANWEVFTRVAHTIKGASANLAANPVSAAAADLEKLGKAADAGGAEAALARLEADIRECIAYIPQALGTGGVSKESNGAVGASAN